MIEYECLQCKKKTFKHPCQQNRKFCSNNCYWSWMVGKKNPSRKKRKKCVCEFCGKEFEKRLHHFKNGKKPKFCSSECWCEYRRQRPCEQHPMWKGGVTRHSSGYILIKAEDNPRADKDGYVYAQVLIMEDFLGRFLKKKEIVHHINGIKDDNRIENLYLCKDGREHVRIHKGWKMVNGKWWKKCNGCDNFLQVNKVNFNKTPNGIWISRCKKCANKKTIR